jgi:hypothetical protein
MAERAVVIRAAVARVQADGLGVILDRSLKAALQDNTMEQAGVKLHAASKQVLNTTCSNSQRE